MSQRVLLQPAFVIHHRPYRDTSLLLDLWTLEWGRIGAVARGVRRPRGRWQALLQPFQPLLVSWSGRGELYSLSEVEAAAPPYGLTGRHMLTGLYVNELMLRLLQRQDPHPDLYGLYERTLAALSDAAADVDPGRLTEQRILRLFEKKLLQQLGYGLVLDHAADSGQALQADQCYHYMLERGPVAQTSSSITTDAIPISGESLLSLANEKLATQQSLRESKRLLRAALEAHLGHKPLQSRLLWQAMAGQW